MTFHCATCNYTCQFESHYKQHEETVKHNNDGKIKKKLSEKKNAIFVITKLKTIVLCKVTIYVNMVQKNKDQKNFHIIVAFVMWVLILNPYIMRIASLKNICNALQLYSHFTFN